MAYSASKRLKMNDFTNMGKEVQKGDYLGKREDPLDGGPKAATSPSIL